MRHITNKFFCPVGRGLVTLSKASHKLDNLTTNLHGYSAPAPDAGEGEGSEKRRKGTGNTECPRLGII